MDKHALSIVRVALKSAFEYHRAEDTKYAARNCAPGVRQSPLTAELQRALTYADAELMPPAVVEGLEA